MVLIQGFALAEYRSYRSVQHFGSLSHINVIAGRNNSGKSNAIHFLKRFVGLSSEIPGELDKPLEASEETEHRFSVAIKLTDLLEVISQKTQQQRENTTAVAETLFNNRAYRRFGEGELVWIDFVTSRSRTASGEERIVGYSSEQHRELDRMPSIASAAQRLSLDIAGHASEVRQDIQTVLTHLQIADVIPPIEVIEAVRQVAAVDDTERLTQLIDDWRDASPGRNSGVSEQRYEALNRLMRRVLDDEEVVIRTKPPRQLSIRTKNRNLALENLGTGLHQLLYIAAMAIKEEGRVVCIEEPEVHMHPSMQRRLLQFLAEQTDNQYIITTHSAAFLDSSLATIFETRLDGQGNSVVRRMSTPDDLAGIATSLGYKASDLIQSNYVVWVEGPSDRLYINLWLRKVAPDLVEGFHYSIMFYGALLSHLNGEDEEDVKTEVTEFVNLCRLNRNYTLVIDSDMSSECQPLAQSKSVAIAQVKRQPRARVWLTDGYTIENYLEKEALNAALRACSRAPVSEWNGDPWVSPLKKYRRKKVRVAREIVKAQSADSTKLAGQLSQRVSELADSIRLAQTDSVDNEK